jgi:allantoinase
VPTRHLDRDFVGYGPHPPRARWPEGARLALNVVINYEEGAEQTPIHGQPERELMSESVYPAPPGERELIQESAYEFGARAGAWRILRTLDRFGTIATVFACGAAIERNQGVATAFVERGYDFVGHGYRWVQHFGMTESQERDDIRQTLRSIEQTTGQRIVGWYTRPMVTTATRRLLAEEGFLYDCDSLADDLPYYVTVNEQPHLVVPYSLDLNDIRFWKGSFFTADDWFHYARDCFDALYAEGADAPKMMSVGLHCRIIGRPGRILALDRFLGYVLGFRDVWICRRTDLARHWLEVHPPR